MRRLSRNRSELAQHRADFRIRHEVLPHEPAPVVFNHDDDWRLIQSHVDRRDPVGSRIERVARPVEDRKSTRLNSSHRTISYAVFCLKKKKKEHVRMDDKM